MELKIFNAVYIALLATGVTVANSFIDASHKADSYMREESRRMVVSMSPRLRPLHHGYHNHQRVKDTPENRAKHSYVWVIDPGDGYLYSAWWE